MAKLIALLSAALFIVVGLPASAASLQGKTMLDGKSSGAGDVVVYLEGGAPSAPLAHAMIDQRNKMFLPHVTVVTKGTKVDFPNHDTVFHNVFAFYQAKKFDLGMYPQGASKSVTFDKTGEVVLLCSVHSDMSAFITCGRYSILRGQRQKRRFPYRQCPAGALHSACVARERRGHDSANRRHRLIRSAGRDPEAQIGFLLSCACRSKLKSCCWSAAPPP